MERLMFRTNTLVMVILLMRGHIRCVGNEVGVEWWPHWWYGVNQVG